VTHESDRQTDGRTYGETGPANATLNYVRRPKLYSLDEIRKHPKQIAIVINYTPNEST